MPQTDQPQSVAPTIAPEIGPIPPRYWWLKRIGIAVGVLLVALFALRLWWGWEANRRLQAEIDRIIAAGEPIYPEDFDPKEDIPDDQNAARLLIQAAGAVSLMSVKPELFDEVVGKPALIKKHLEEVRGVVEGNSEALTLVRRARGLPGSDWGVRIRTPAINAPFPAFSSDRRLSKLIGLSAMIYDIEDRNSEAIEILRDGLAHADNINQQPTLISQLVAWACEALTIQTIEGTLPSLHIARDDGNSMEGVEAASRSQIRDLIAELLDERPLREGMRRAMMCERMYQVDIHNELMRSNTTMSALIGWQGPLPLNVPDVIWRHALGPAITLDIAATLRGTTSLVEAADTPFYSGVPDTGDDSAEVSGYQFLIHPFLGSSMASLHRAFVLYFRVLARRRETGAALAIRLYKIDHGRHPEALAELVPEYIPHIPEDPFAEDGQTLRYFPNALHPMVYSIGDNGLDEGGKSEGWEDIVFFLDGWRPEDESDEEAIASTKAGENNGDVESEEGEADEDGEGEEEP